jgi:hypothetical protein
MRDRHVVILALGATRKRAAVEDATRAVADGGEVTVVIDSAAGWRRDNFPSQVRIVELSKLERRNAPLWIEQLLLYRIPRVLFRLAGRGPLTDRMRRAGSAYQRRFADRVHRRLFLPVYGRVSRTLPYRLVRRHVLAGSDVDLVVIGDPASMPLAGQILKRSAKPPRLSYGVDHSRAPV